MGCVLSAEEVRSNQIDDILRKDGEKDAKQIKLLLLGKFEECLATSLCERIGVKHEYHPNNSYTNLRYLVLFEYSLVSINLINGIIKTWVEIIKQLDFA